MRGGDCGMGACGGMDLFTAAWLPRATAFFLDCSGGDGSQGHRRPHVRAFPLG